MSDVVDPLPSGPPPPPEVAPALPAPIETGGPYRVPDPNAMAPLVYPPYVPVTTWPIFGPALCVFGVLLWSFVIAGELTTSWIGGSGPLPEGVALLFVFVTSLAAWIASLGRSRTVAPPRSAAIMLGRALGIGALSFLLFFVGVFLATVAASAGRGHDFAIAFFLVALATGAAILGRAIAPSPRMRGAPLLWAAGTILTLVAGIELAANG